MQNAEVIQRLRDECDAMRSRVEAILDCKVAIDHLESYDVFGEQYPAVLQSDVFQLSDAIALADVALKARCN